MKPDKKFDELLSKVPIQIDQQAVNRLIDYLLLIKQWSKKMNLVSYTDRKDVFVKHFIPSFWFFETIELEKPNSILDIGTGAGFPGLILNILKPRVAICLVESNRKKTLFLKEAAEQLDIYPQIINDRIENFITETNKTFDVIVGRSVTSLKQIWEWSNGLLSKNGYLFVIKGTDYKIELNQENSIDFKISEIVPGIKWTSSSPNLKNKIIVKMTKA